MTLLEQGALEKRREIWSKWEKKRKNFFAQHSVFWELWLLELMETGGFPEVRQGWDKSCPRGHREVKQEHHPKFSSPDVGEAWGARLQKMVWFVFFSLNVISWGDAQCGTEGHSLVGMVVMGWWLDLILVVFSNLNDSMILWFQQTLQSTGPGRQLQTQKDIISSQKVLTFLQDSKRSGTSVPCGMVEDGLFPGKKGVPDLRIIESQNHRVTNVGKDLSHHLV